MKQVSGISNATVQEDLQGDCVKQMIGQCNFIKGFTGSLYETGELNFQFSSTERFILKPC